MEVSVGCSAVFSTKSVHLSAGLETYVWISKKYDEWDFDGNPDKAFYCLYCNFRNWNTAINLTEIAYGLHSQRPVKNSENTHSGYLCGTRMRVAWSDETFIQQRHLDGYCSPREEVEPAWTVLRRQVDGESGTKRWVPSFKWTSLCSTYLNNANIQPSY